MSWANSDRRARLPKDWPARVRRAKKRARGACEGRDVVAAGVVGHAPRCDGIGTECDHIAPGDDHSDANLQMLSTACHRAKTAREAREAREAKRNRGRKPPRRHPGQRP